MSSSFPEFYLDEIILRHGSQDLYFMIIHNSVTLTAAKPGSHSIIYLDSITYWFYLYMISLTFSGTFSRKIPKRYSVTFRNSGTTFRKFPVYGENRSGNRSGIPEFQISGTFSIMEIKKFPDHFRT